MPGNTRRAPSRSSRKARRGRGEAAGTAGDWLKRWEAAVPFAAARYANAMRHQAEAAIDKYIKALQRRLILNDKRRRRRPGA